ncbi:MAG: 3-hydroxyacyl-[acyl-carrier-protein] dehydratase [Acidobacteriota bacterium]|jgi:beta-hydroxyacyl-ACP dehydratase FabZ|nr:3-hydroxyacyl-[acyl-carrier-protein] dehydratase [Acidobacteriota bacterium]
METVLDIRAIQDILPHRYPFLLVDRIVELTRGVRIVGIKQVTINEHFFQGHFPGAPVMPGVLILEAMAQVGAVYALQQLEARDDKLVLFSGIDNGRFRRPVVPGDTLVITVTPVRVGSRIQKMHGEAHVEGQLAAEADIMSVVVPKSKAADSSQ